MHGRRLVPGCVGDEDGLGRGIFISSKKLMDSDVSSRQSSSISILIRNTKTNAGESTLYPRGKNQG